MFERLVAEADVLIEDCAPGERQSLGLDLAQLWWEVNTPPDASPWRVARGCCLVRGVKDRKLPQTRAEWSSSPRHYLTPHRDSHRTAARV